MQFNWNPDWSSLLPTRSGVADVLRKIDPDDHDGLAQIANLISAQTGQGMGAAAERTTPSLVSE